MLRRAFMAFGKSAKEPIRWRSHEPSRIEAFSDAAFGFALSLLVVSLEVPKSSGELLEKMRGFIPFIFCFGGIFLIWHEQYKFFRRYGMHDGLTIALNGALIFLVLFYAYPLKFLFCAMLQGAGYTISITDLLPLLCVYCGGIAGIYFLFALMYHNATRRKEELALTPEEVFVTQNYMYTNLYTASVSVVTIIVSIMLNYTKVGAPLGMACWGLMSGFKILENRRKKLFKQKFGNAVIAEPQLGTEV